VLLEVKTVGASTAPNESVATRPVVAALIRNDDPAVLKPNAACPWPETTTDGIQYQRAEKAEAAGSKIVPDWTTVGVPDPTGTFNSYQRTASRSPLDATPLELTAILCAVHNRPLRMCAAKRRSSSASSAVLVATEGTSNGNAVASTVIVMLSEMLGVPPGLLMRRMISSPKVASPDPIM
jgi:hypothetical protein